MKVSKVPYVVVPKKNPQNPSAKPKFYAQLIGRYKIGMKELLDDMTTGSAINPIEAKGIIERFLTEVGIHLQYGRKVDLDGLGSFYITVRSNGSGSPEEFTAGNIRKKSIRFNAGVELKAMLDNVQFVKTDNGTEATDS